jgi:hypothetical protein
MNSLPERVSENYSPVPESGCWIWLGSLNPLGYGSFHGPSGKNVRAHRAFYEHYKGPIPRGMYVCHKCDTPSCVNRDHLFAVAPKDNHWDMHRKGRRGGLKLEEWQAREILLSSERSVVLARRFGVNPATICDIRSERSWTHLGIKPTPAVYRPSRKRKAP